MKLAALEAHFSALIEESQMPAEVQLVLVAIIVPFAMFAVVLAAVDRWSNSGEQD